MPDPYISEFQYVGGGALDFVEVAVDQGADVSNIFVTIYDRNGLIRSSDALSTFGPPMQSGGRDVYVVDDTAGNFTGFRRDEAVALSEGDTPGSTVYAFYSVEATEPEITATEGAASGLTSTNVGETGGGESLETSDDGGTYFLQTSPNPGTIPCFAQGTQVQTRHGAMPVDDIDDGTEILTLDGTYKPLMRKLQSQISAQQLRDHPTLYPVRICAGALGHHMPQSDLLVSRQHRMLVCSPIVERMFGTQSVLISAIKLTALPGVYVDTSVETINYFHLLFAEHEVIFAEGAPTESLLLGPEALKSLPSHIVDEMRLIFPEEFAAFAMSTTKHVIPSNRRQLRLIERHRVNERQVLCSFQSGHAASETAPAPSPE